MLQDIQANGENICLPSSPMQDECCSLDYIRSPQNRTSPFFSGYRYRILIEDLDNANRQEQRETKNTHYSVSDSVRKKSCWNASKPWNIRIFCIKARKLPTYLSTKCQTIKLFDKTGWQMARNLLPVSAYDKIITENR
jgi:hypothetical protein